VRGKEMELSIVAKRDALFSSRWEKEAMKPNLGSASVL